MENYIRISTLNDFVFCPKSIYYHELYQKYATEMYHETAQNNGKLDHELIDLKKYSTSKDVLQGMDVYCDKYGLCGKIDLYHTVKKSLVERKSKIERVYLGYKYQLYAQYFCLKEMGYEVEKITCYSLQNNKVYDIPLPDETETVKFEKFLEKYRTFRPNQQGFTQNPKKCERCIYRELCDYYLAHNQQKNA